MPQQHGLSWGALDFTSRVPTEEGFLWEAVADGTHFGNPEAQVQVVKSLLTDGALAVLEGWGNREQPIRLRCSAPEAIAGPALAAGEAAVMAELLAERKAPLIVTPPATDAADCYFDVVVATLEKDVSDGQDLEEVLREYRYYLLTLTALPFARTRDKVVLPALPVAPDPGSPPTFVNIDTCDSFTGWSGFAVSGGGGTTGSPASGAASGYVYVEGTKSNSASYTVALVRTGAVSMASTPLLTVDVLVLGPGGNPPDPVVSFDSGSAVAAIAAQTAPTPGTGIRYYFEAPASFNKITIEARSLLSITGTMRMNIYAVGRTDGIGVVSSTARQQVRNVAVSGAAPTQAAIRVFDATPGPLGGEILVHTTRNANWQPPLRRWRTSSSAVTSDTGRVSGGRNTLAAAMVFRIPANLVTEGTYSLMALMNVSTAGVLGWSARMVSSAGAATVGSSVTVTGSITVPTTAGSYKVLNLAALPLPVLDVEADQMIELTLTGTANMTLDEAWLFGLHDGALTWLQDTDSLSWIEIRSPELGAARPSIYGGTGAKGTGAVCVDWKAQSFGVHRFDPGPMRIFTVASSSLVAQSEIEFYPRGHSYVMDEWAA